MKFLFLGAITILAFVASIPQAGASCTRFDSDSFLKLGTEHGAIESRLGRAVDLDSFGESRGGFALDSKRDLAKFGFGGPRWRGLNGVEVMLRA
jgi:hypothetical protein